MRLASGHNGVARNELGHDTSSSLDTQRQRVDVHEHDTTSTLLTRKNTTLNRGAKRDSLIWVDALAGFFAIEELLKERLDLGNASGSTDQDNIIDIRLLDLGILDDLLDGLERLLEEVHVEFLKLGAGQRLGEVLALVEGLDFDARRHLRR